MEDILCEFWLLRCSTMVARAWPVSVEVIQDWLCLLPRVQTEPIPHVSIDTSILRYPFDLFQLEVYGTCLLRCSKWLLGEWLDSFTMILRLLIGRSESNEPTPCLYDTVIQSYVQLKSRVSSQWGNFGTSLAPQGCKFYPIVWVCSYRARQPLQMWQISHFYEIHSLSYESVNFGLLRWSTMVARAWPVCVEVDSGLAACLPPSQTSPPSCFYDTSSWDIPLISFNGSQWDVLLRCSKWLLGAWLW